MLLCYDNNIILKLWQNTINAGVHLVFEAYFALRLFFVCLFDIFLSNINVKCRNNIQNKFNIHIIHGKRFSTGSIVFRSKTFPSIFNFSFTCGSAQIKELCGRCTKIRGLTKRKRAKYSREPNLFFHTKRLEQRKHRATLCVQAAHWTLVLLLASSSCTFTHTKTKLKRAQFFNYIIWTTNVFREKYIWLTTYPKKIS